MINDVNLASNVSSQVKSVKPLSSKHKSSLDRNQFITGFQKSHISVYNWKELDEVRYLDSVTVWEVIFPCLEILISYQNTTQ